MACENNAPAALTFIETSGLGSKVITLLSGLQHPNSSCFTHMQWFTDCFYLVCVHDFILSISTVVKCTWRYKGKERGDIRQDSESLRSEYIHV